MNRLQRDRFAAIAAYVPDCRMSLANSAGISLGRDYHFDLTRPGLSLYGGIARPEAQGHIRQVAGIEAQILQRRTLLAGESLGYNATFTADRTMELAILNLGYADGYWRGFSGRGRALAGDVALPVMGRVSMDLTAICVDDMAALQEGDWVQIDFELSHAAQMSGMSPYELLTGLGGRFERHWA
jgi:alanine racemase